MLAAVASGADVLHALDIAAAPAALRVRRRTGVPAIVQAQIVGSEHIGEQGRPAWLACLRAADTVVVPTTQDARAAGSVGLDPRRVVTVLLAAAGEVAPSTAFSGRSPDRLVSVLSGPHAWGGTLDVVAAVSRLPDVQLVVAGRSAVREAAERLTAAAQAAGSGDRVVVTGWLDEAEAVELVDRSAVVVAPRRGLTSGSVTLRAMARARPVVAVESPVQAEIVVDGETGVLVPAGSRSRLTESLAELAGRPLPGRGPGSGRPGPRRGAVRSRAHPRRTRAGLSGRTRAARPDRVHPQRSHPGRGRRPAAPAVRRLTGPDL